MTALVRRETVREARLLATMLLPEQRSMKGIAAFSDSRALSASFSATAALTRLMCVRMVVRK